MLDLKYLSSSGIQPCWMYFSPFCTVPGCPTKLACFRCCALKFSPRRSKSLYVRRLDWMPSNFSESFWHQWLLHCFRQVGDNAHHRPHCTFFSVLRLVWPSQLCLKPSQFHSVTLLGQTEVVSKPQARDVFLGKRSSSWSYFLGISSFVVCWWWFSGENGSEVLGNGCNKKIMLGLFLDKEHAVSRRMKISLPGGFAGQQACVKQKPHWPEVQRIMHQQCTWWPNGSVSSTVFGWNRPKNVPSSLSNLFSSSDL